MNWTLARLGLAIFLSLNVMMFTMALWSQDDTVSQGANVGRLAESLADLFRYLCLVLSLPVLFLLGAPILESAWSNGRRGAAATDALIVLGVAAAYVYSVISVLRGAGHVYFEVGCAVLVMVTLGRWLEANGKFKTTEALDALEKLLPLRVRLADTQGRDTIVGIADVRIGDLLHVLPGERLATDGRIEFGQAALDQQMLTGESQPVLKEPGADVLGGSLNLDGDLIVRVTTRPEQSSLATIVEAVRQARFKKGRYERMADRVARWFLPGVILVAAGAVVFHASHGGVDQGLLAGLAVLLIACPCALGLATPMAVWSALGTASRAGVLFRDGEAIERLGTIRAIRFDKTGTLTTGAPRIHRFVVSDPCRRGEVLRRAGGLARASTHPYSAAIAEMADEFGAADATPGPVVCTSPGQGLLTQFHAGETPTRLGSLSWLQQSRLRMDDGLNWAVTEAMVGGHSLSAIGWNGRIEGLFVFCETLRPGAREALWQCAAEVRDVGVLTGDHHARGRTLARELGVRVQAELLPAAKVAALAEARSARGPVAMVGDGINDAPALAASDLGIALGCGADIARESASVCLVGNDVSLVPWAIRLARDTRRVMRQNLFWAFGYNIVGIGLAASGWLNPAWAAVAMVASSSLVVTNSLRLSRIALPSGPSVERSEPPRFEKQTLRQPAAESASAVPVSTT
jgi:heavy metal translocating P-type ATPase